MKNRPLNLSKSETGRHLVDILKYSSPRNPLRHRGSTGLFGRPAVDMGAKETGRPVGRPVGKILRYHISLTV